MKIEVNIPSVGESIVSGILAKWLVKNNDIVGEGDNLFEMETEKATVEVPSPAAGRIEISAAEGDEINVGQVVAYIETDATVKKKEAAETPPVEKKVKKEEEKIKTETPRKEAAVKEKNDDKGKTTVKMSPIRRTIAAKLVQAKQEAAHLTTFNEINMEHVINIRSKYKDSFLKKYGIKLGFMSFFVKASCQSLKEFREVNTMVSGNDIVYFNYYNIGVAVAVEQGLIVPVIKDADTLSFAQIELQIHDLGLKAKEKKIALSDLQDGTFTITNGGVFGSMLSTPIPSYPQTAILGLHAIKDRAYVVEGKIEVKPIMYVALTYDHRVIDGKEAVGFLMNIKKYIEDPESLLIEL